MIFTQFLVKASDNRYINAKTATADVTVNVIGPIQPPVFTATNCDLQLKENHTIGNLFTVNAISQQGKVRLLTNILFLMWSNSNTTCFYVRLTFTTAVKVKLHEKSLWIIRLQECKMNFFMCQYHLNRQIKNK